MNSNQLLNSFRRSFTIRLVFSVLLGLSSNLGGALADTPSLADRVIEHRLGNGMTVLMVERHQTPVVSINLTFGVGGMNEQVGQTGLAHLYEHMAFKGTRTVGTKDYEKEQAVLEELHRVGAELEQYQGGESGAVAPGSDGAKGQPTARIEALQQRFKELQEKDGEYVLGNEMALLYQRHGAVGLNASTGKDITRYVINLPANRLPLWAALEADRMAHPVLREFYKERGVVMEERRLRTDDSPTGLLYETFTSTAFQAHPYGVPTIGWASVVWGTAGTSAACQLASAADRGGSHSPGFCRSAETEKPGRARWFPDGRGSARTVLWRSAPRCPSTA